MYDTTLADTLAPALEIGRVTAVEGADCLIATENGVVRAEQAVACLVAPEPGDLVLLCREKGPESERDETQDAGAAWVLSILSRPDGANAPRSIVFPGPAHIHAASGALKLTAEHALQLASGDQLGLATDHLEIHARAGAAHIEEMSFVGRLCRAQIERIKCIAQSVDTIAKRLVQRLTTSYRYVAEHEEVQSASTRLIVDGTLTLKTQQTMHTAEGHIKMDAKQIHLG